MEGWCTRVHDDHAYEPHRPVIPRHVRCGRAALRCAKVEYSLITAMGRMMHSSDGCCRSADEAHWDGAARACGLALFCGMHRLEVYGEDGALACMMLTRTSHGASLYRGTFGADAPRCVVRKRNKLSLRPCMGIPLCTDTLTYGYHYKRVPEMLRSPYIAVLIFRNTHYREVRLSLYEGVPHVGVHHL